MNSPAQKSLFPFRLPAFLLFFSFIAGSQFAKGQQEATIHKEKRFAWLHHYIDQFNRERGFSGGVLIAKDGEIVLERTIGWQDVKNEIVNTPATRFNLGSGNKMFTAVAIGQLVEAGKLNFGDPIGKYLPDYPDTKFARKATIHHLLTHTSGLADYWDDKYEEHWHQLTTLEERLPFITDKKLLFEPGEQFSYSNSGFILLGLIIERLTGQSYFGYIREHIYQRLGMQNTDSFRNDRTVPGLAVAYQGLTEKWHEARHGLVGTSAGGGFSTLRDMLKFDDALKKNLLLSAETTKVLRSDKTPANQKNNWGYGYGFIDDRDNGAPRLGHGGMGPGVLFEYYHYPDNGYTLILFSNSESGAPNALFRRISDFISDPAQIDVPLPKPGNTQEAPDPFRVQLVEPPDPENFMTVLEPGSQSNYDQYWKAISHLAFAINQEDLTAFNQQFANQDLVTLASNRSMYEFMIKQVIPGKGKIKAFHLLSNPIQIEDSPFPIRVGTFHLEDGYPGSISVALNEENRIEHLSLFVHPQICPHGPSKDCPEVELLLEKAIPADTLPEVQAYFSALIVRNLDNSIRWYRDHLGFQVSKRSEILERGIKQANLERDGVLVELIELGKAVAPEEVIPNHSSQIRLLGIFKIGFRVEDFGKCIKRWRSSKVNFHGDAVIDPVSGKRTVILLDPDKNRVQIFEK